jgi:hypothetical protein
LGLSGVVLARMAKGVTDELRYVFAVDWSPRWLRPGEIHLWDPPASSSRRAQGA